MPSLRERVAAMRVSATTPDGAATIEVVGGYTARISVSSRHYDVMSEGELAHALQQVMRLGFAARKRGYDEIRAEALGERRTPITGSREERELAELQALVDASSAEGVSSDGAVTAFASNMTNWVFTVQPGTRGLLDAAAFGERASEAVNRLVEEHLRTVKGIRARYRREHPAPV
ncbi:hypothetical protein [Nocardioides marinquilinus]